MKIRFAALVHDIAKPQTKKYEKGHGWTFHAHEFIGGKMVPKIFKKHSGFSCILDKPSINCFYGTLYCFLTRRRVVIIFGKYSSTRKIDCRNNN